MRFRGAFSKAVFCLATAVTAAAVVDPVVERLSDAGLFGQGNFTDHSSLDVIPALFVGFLLCALFVAATVRRALRRSPAPDWLRHCALSIGECSAGRLLPLIFAAQLGVLWTMETLEQAVVAGHPLGGTIWLGGPILISLAAHAAGCVVFTWMLSRALRRSAQAIFDVVSFIRYLLVLLRPNGAQRRARPLNPAFPRPLEPVLARLCGRAPPYLSA